MESDGCLSVLLCSPKQKEKRELDLEGAFRFVVAEVKVEKRWQNRGGFFIVVVLVLMPRQSTAPLTIGWQLIVGPKLPL